MDLKRVQEELKNDIMHHQALMQQLKRNPLDQALRLKLKAVQKHIAELGSQQKRISAASRIQNVPSLNDGALSSQHTSQKLDKTSYKTNPSYAFITIKNSLNPTTTNHNSANLPINLSHLPSSSSSGNKLQPPTLLVVTSSSQIAVNRPAIRANVTQKATALPISLSSLVSTGGIVTLAGGWKGGPPPLSSVGLTTASQIGRLIPGKQVQIKVPVVQSSGSNQVILVPQKPSPNTQQKSLFKLLPKGRHPIPVNTTRIAVSRGASVVVGNQSNTVKSPMVTQKQFPTFIMRSDAPVNNTQSIHQVIVQRVGNTRPNYSSVTTPTSVTWQDLSSRTPAIHKPSYVPRKSFPNINNGVGSFQKFRILDGKTQILPKQLLDSSLNNTTYNHGIHEKPRNAALKAVLTSSNPVVSTSNMVTLARLLPSTIPQNGFYPIQPQQTPTVIEANPTQKLFRNSPSTLNTSSFVPVTISTISSTSTARPAVRISKQDSKSGTPVMNDQIGEKLSYLRNIDLIPREQAEKVRGRRFRKRRVAANPIYSGGMYISNELESKRHCSDIMAGALECITAPDVIVKRPRGRPRGSKNVLSSVPRFRSSTRGVRSSSTSPVLPAHVEELKGILDVVASASKAVSSAGAAVTETEINTVSTRIKQEDCTVKEEPTRLTSTIESEKKDKENDGSADEHEDQCAICGKTGEVLMCDTCSRVYHLSCATPPLVTVPLGMWICSKCKSEFKDSKPRSEWPGIVSAVHSYVEHDKQRDRDIAKEHEQLQTAKKCIGGLQIQTKSMTTAVMNKVNLRSKAMKEKQSLSREMAELSSIIQSVWNLQHAGKNQ